MKKNIMLKKVSGRVLKIVLVVIGVGMTAFLSGVWQDASSNACKVHDALQAWDDKGLTATAAWQARELLANLWWLGPLRPSPPQDPLEACGVQEGVGWWSLLVRTSYTKQLLVCLEEQMAKAEAEHDIFTLKLACLVFGLVVPFAFLASLYFVLSFPGDKTKKPSPEQCVDAVVEAAEDGVQEDEKVGNLEEADSSGVTGQDDVKLVPIAVDDEVLPSGEAEQSEEPKEDTKELVHVETLPLSPPEQAEAPPEGQGICKKRKKRRKKTRAQNKEEEDVSGEWQVVCRKRKKRPATVCDKEENPKAVEASVKPKKKKKRAPARRQAAPRECSRDLVRQSWKEDPVKVVVTVPPGRRQHVIGPRGDTIRKLGQDYPAVRVTVPLPQDRTSHHVTLEGPKSQVTAAAQDITGRLEAINAQIREAAKRRQGNTVRVVVEVSPNMRRHLVGPGGEELIRLAHHHPGVTVSLPPRTDKESRTVTIRGPPDEVTAVEGWIRTRLQAVKRRRQMLKAKKGPLQKAAAKN